LKNKSYILFFVSVISIALAVYVYNLKSSLISESRLKQEYFSEIQNNLDFHASRMYTEVEKGMAYLENGNINEFESDYAIFHINNGYVNHWTDYHIPYNLKFSSGAVPWKVIKTSQGVFLVYSQSKVSSKGVDQVMAVIDLYRDYKLSSSYLKSGYNKDVFDEYKVLRMAINETGGVLLKVSNYPLWRIDLDIAQERRVGVIFIWLILLAIGFLFIF